MLLGLTGGYCAGKNAVATILEGQGWTCIDVDRLGHEAVELARDAIVGRFGAAVIGPDGKLDRKAIALIVFADPAALAEQEAIVHPIAIRLVDERIAASAALAAAAGKEPLTCVNAALLYRTPQVSRCDAIIEVRAPLPLRLRRARLRDGVGARRAFKRILSQRSFWRLRGESGRPVTIIRNSGSLEALAVAAGKAIEVLRRDTARGAIDPTRM
jgi:dephospho-CoA kinase